MACTASALYGQKPEQVRTWKGLLGRTQFGVFSSDGRRLVYADGRDAVIADTVDGGNEVRLSGHIGPVWVARFSGDGKKVVTVGQDETVRVWETTTGKQVREIFANTSGRCTTLTVSRTGNLAGFSTDKDRMLRMMDLVKENERGHIGLTVAKVSFRCLTRDCRYAMSNGITNGTKFWDTVTGRSQSIDNGHHNYCGQFSHDGRFAILGGAFQWDIWDLRRKMRIAAGTVTGGHVYAVAMSRKGDRMLTGLSDGVVWGWDVRAGTEQFVLRGHEAPIHAVMLSPDGGYALIADNGQNIILWRVGK